MRMTEQEKFGIAALTSVCGMRHSQVAHLFEISIGRIFVKWTRTLSGLPDGSDTFSRTHSRWTSLAQQYLDEHHADVTHVIDWLTSSWLEAYPWLLRQDDQHRPLKLMKCGSLERLVHEAEKAEARLHQRDPHFLSLTSKDEVFVADLGAGYTLVRLLSPDALDMESDRMRHCIGHGSYDEDLAFGTSAFYSVRDQEGAPRATLEIVGREVDGNLYGHIKQFRGRRNADPEAHVVDLVGGIKTAMRWLDGPRTKSQAPEMATDEDLAVAFLRGGNLR